jgi:ubiquinone/menaquinone biosynthesis C-methylase UbiE
MDINLHDPVMKAALALHAGLPRQGPGSAASTRLLLSLARPFPEPPRVLDLGCGPGSSALVLAEELHAEVTALDIYEPFLEELRASAERRGLSGRVRTEARSMDDLPYPDGSFDLVWSESAAYNLGMDRALNLWKRLLSPQGVLVITECGWITDSPCEEAREFWDALYPLRSTGENVAAATAAGYTVEATYLLPDEDWFVEYYTPLEERARAVDPADTAGVEAARFQLREIALRRAHAADYGYVGYVLRPRP